MNGRRSKWRLFAALLWLVLGVSAALAALQHGDALPGLLDPYEIELAAPQRLWLVVVAWFVPLAALFSLTDMPAGQQLLQVALRMALIGALVLALAGPRTRRDQPRGVQVVHVVDRSESMQDDALKHAARVIRDSHINSVSSGDVTTDIVRFDRVARRLPWPPTGTDDEADDTIPLPDLRRSAGTSRGTDLAAALNIALGLIDDSRVGHIVLWTDGIETAGHALGLAGAFAAAGVRIHTPAMAQAASQPAEMVVERVETPAGLRANIPFPVSVAVRATRPMSVRCRVEGGTAAPEPVIRSVPAGASLIALGRLRFAKGGHHDMKVSCEVPSGGDRFADNNTMRTRVAIQARPRILYLEGAAGQGRYLADALKDDFDVKVLGPQGLPRKVDQMKAYHAIILSDIARNSPAGVPQLTDGDMRNLHKWVLQGGGLLVLGGQDSLGSGGYQGTHFDRHVLPVRMEIESRVEMPSIAMMLLIDRSGSMSGRKIELAKEAARATAEALGAEDRIGIIQFDNIARPLVRLQRAGNRYRIATQINKLTASGGTHIYPALQQAHTALTGVQARVKHVILLSDGQAPRRGIDALVRGMRNAGITVSTVGVGAEVDRSLIESIADRGGGRFYFTDRPETLPRIFVRETRQIAGKSVVETRVKPVKAPGLGRIDLLRGVDLRRAPALHGFLPTRAKRSAEEILRLNTGQPLLVRWRLGLGKVTVWTSDLKNRWAHGWIDWPGYGRLSRQIVRDLMQEEIGRRVLVQLSRERSRLRVAVDAVDDDDTYMRGLHASARLTLPGGVQRQLPLPEVAIGRYEATTPMERFGPYEVHVDLRGDATRPPLATGSATAVHPYPDEYRSFDTSATALPALVSATGGSASATPAEWLERGGATHERWQWLWPDLVWLALGLLLLDIALRRIRLGPARATDWYRAR